MDLRWLAAPADEVAAAMANVRRDSRPNWVPTRRQVLVHVNWCLILWYVCIVLLRIGVQVDVRQDGRVEPADVLGLVVAAGILALWLYGTYWLHRWARLPASSPARLAGWRATLTALANGYESKPTTSATFPSMFHPEHRSVRKYPRFVASGIEFGTLRPRSRHAGEWQYLAVRLAAPLPHLILDATANNRLRSDLPIGIDRGQRVSLEGDFDRFFHVYSPVEYRMEALYVLTPDVMTALIDNASHLNVEIIDDTIVFFASPAADLADPDYWQTLEAILTGVIPRITAKAQRYLDERVPGQEVPRVLARLRAERDQPEIPWIEPEPRIGAEGRRLEVGRRLPALLSVLGAAAWITTRTLLYVVPGILGFAGFMVIIDGR